MRERGENQETRTWLAKSSISSMETSGNEISFMVSVLLKQRCNLHVPIHSRRTSFSTVYQSNPALALFTQFLQQRLNCFWTFSITVRNQPNPSQSSTVSYLLMYLGTVAQLWTCMNKARASVIVWNRLRSLSLEPRESVHTK